MPRFYCPAPLHAGAELELPAGAARHVQVLRLQPGDSITLFNSGFGLLGEVPYQDAGEFEASITRMGRSDVAVRVGLHQQPQREPACDIYLAVGMPANDRMDWLIEKATELGVAGIWPLQTERSVLRLSGERADKKVAHWQSIAIAACEQCGGNRVPLVHAIMGYSAWLQRQTGAPGAHALLSLHPQSVHLQRWRARLPPPADRAPARVTLLSGPEGGLSRAEEESALRLGFAPVSLGNRVLRAETAALCALAGLLL